MGSAAFHNTGVFCFQSSQFIDKPLPCRQQFFFQREHRRNMQTCMNVMLDNGVIPIVNENDTVSIAELMFTDNDELSGLIARMMNVDTLIILSNIDGLYDGNPETPGTSLIHEVLPGNRIDQYIQAEKSVVGRGGMQSKCTTAMTVASSGIDVYLARGTRENVLTDLLLSDARVPHTHFVRQ
jgi:glutamate 5-kinase